MSYVDWKNKIETIRLFATDEILDLFTNKNYNQFFIDCTYTCIPQISDSDKLVVCVGYNS